MGTSIALIDPFFDGSMAHRSLDVPSMEKKSQVDDVPASLHLHLIL